MVSPFLIDDPIRGNSTLALIVALTLKALVECGCAQLLFERLPRQVLRATKQWSPDRTTRISTARGDEKVAIKRYFLVNLPGMVILCS